MKINFKTLLLCIAVPLLVGGLSGFITQNSMQVFEQLVKPPLAPPGWVFPVVWTVLYVLMGIAFYLIITSGGDAAAIVDAITVYELQLAVNFFWPIFFFRFGWYLFAFLWLVLLWLLILANIVLFNRISKTAARLMVPYLLWVTFAGYLNLAIYLMN